MDKIKEITYKGINNYFNSLSTLGYRKYKDVYNLIFLIFLEELLDSSLSIYVTEDDYKTISNVLYCLYGSTCLIPYPEYISGTSLIQSLNSDNVRLSENNLIRISENEFIRLVNE